MKINLNMAERVTLLGLLPNEGDFVDLRVIREAQTALGVTDEEHKEYEITSEKLENGSVAYKWNEKGLQEKEIELPDRAGDILKNTLTEMDKKKKLNFNHLTVYEKLVQGK